MSIDQLLRSELDARTELEREGVDPYNAVRAIDARAADTTLNPKAAPLLERLSFARYARGVQQLDRHAAASSYS